MTPNTAGASRPSMLVVELHSMASRHSSVNRLRQKAMRRDGFPSRGIVMRSKWQASCQGFLHTRPCLRVADVLNKSIFAWRRLLRASFTACLVAHAKPLGGAAKVPDVFGRFPWRSEESDVGPARCTNRRSKNLCTVPSSISSQGRKAV